MDFFESIFRFMFAWIDKIVAWLIVLAYNLFETISDTNIFNDDVLQMFSRRVYALLAIFMLFKLSFSIITYIINPDDFSDKNKGFGKLITNVFVVLILIVSVPEVFKLAYNFQGLVVKNNTINKLILGVGGSPDFGEDITAGHIMSYTVYTAFVTPNPNFPGMGGNCDDMYLKQELSAECSNVIGQAVSTDGFYKLVNAIKKYDAQSLLSYDLIVNAKKDKQFLFNYIPLISSVCAGIIAWILLVFCIDIAIRVVKLGFLQLIAPIPIISYIDPKSSKDGMFKKWTKVCISTYLDLFVRLIAISFAIFIINIVGSGTITSLSDKSKVISIDNNGFLEFSFIKILIIIGALLFAKQIPKLIEDITGIKIDGKFTLNPMKRINEAPILGTTAAIAGGALSGAVAGHRVGSTWRGAMAGAFMGGKAVPLMGSKDGKSAFAAGANTAYKQLLGKDYMNFSPEKLFLSQGVGKKAVEEVKTPIKNAYKELNRLNTDLNIISHSSAEEASILRSKGIDLKNLDSERSRLEAQRGVLSSKGAEIKSKLENINSRMQTMRNDYEAAKSSLNSGVLTKGTKAYDEAQAKISRYEQAYKELENESKTLTSNYNNTQSELNMLNELMGSIDKYKNLSTEETKLRGDISKVEKAIKDLSSEKSQRERFYNYDPSPTKDVNELIAEYDPNSRQAKLKEAREKKE